MYIQPNKQNWSGRVDNEHDEKHFRFHQKVTLKNVDDLGENENAFTFVGFESDEGVRRNKGRTGAKEGPDAIRRMLAKLPSHTETSNTIDIGNIRCEGEDLEGAQAELGTTVTHLLQKAGTPIILGGGHETLYGHYLGIRDFIGPEASLGIINIDAHFDMRDEKEATSGTMFKQILDADDKAGYLCLGIQKMGNTQALFDTADAYGCTYIYEDVIEKNNFQTTFQMIDDFAQKYDFIMMTLCTDSITSSDAPGVSAPSPFGLEPKTVRTLLRHVAKKQNLMSFDISEVNPALDEHDKTIKLAALLTADVMMYFNREKVRP